MREHAGSKMADSAEVVLKFIRSDKTKNGLLSKAADAAQKLDLDVVWLDLSDTEDIGVENDQCILVCDAFEGQNFEKLKAQNRRIVGPPCLLYCLEQKSPLPNVKHPVYSMTMEGITVCCTSVPKKDRNKLYELIQYMNGSFVRALTDTVTHVVAGEVGSEKYRVALRYGKPIMLPEWICKSWEECQNRVVCATDEEFNKYKTPCFKGCTICVTGIAADKRKEIKELASVHGGVYSGDLNMNTCTHLLVNAARGEKYNFARRWNVHCVCSGWFYDCIKAGHWLDEADYRTLPDNDQSTSGQRLSLMNLTTVNSSTISNVSTKSNEKRTASKTAAQAAYKSAKKHGDTSLIANNSKQNRNSSSRNTTRSESEFITELCDDAFDVTLQPGDLFLDGCKIYLSGFSGVRLDKLRKIINSGGGTRFNQINESISHVVMGTKVDSDVEVLAHSSFQPKVVSALWLLDSARSGKRLAEEGYLCLHSSEVEMSVSSKDDKEPVKQKENTEQDGAAAMLSTQMGDGDGYSEFDDDVFQQYLQASGMLSALEQEQPQGDQSGMKEMESEKQDRAYDDQDATVDESMECKILAGKTFRFIGFAPEQVCQLVELISKFGGTQMLSEQLVDFVVTPMNYEAEHVQAKNKVTFCWLEQSLEARELLEPSSSLLFKPLSIPEGCAPLEGCVLSISQFVGPERDHLLQLAELLGAHCQEHFVRKPSSNLLASTHLLLQKPEGSKYNAAIKWNIPVVSQQWLFACAKSGKLENLESYPVGSKEDETKDKGLDTVASELKATNSTSPASNKKAAEKLDSNGADPQYKLNTENHRAGEVQSQAATKGSKPLIRKSWRPSFDLTDALAEVASPLVTSVRSRKSRGSRHSFPLDDLFAENVQQGLKNAVRAGDGHQSQMQLPVAEQDIHSGDTRGILHGVILAVSKKLNVQQSELYTIASSIGADYRWIYDESCTHLIHQGRANDSTKEYTLARERGIHIVSPHWLHACASEAKRVDESHYPHTYNPKMTLASVVTSGPKRVTRSSKQPSTSAEQVDSTEDTQPEPQSKRPKGVAEEECPPSNGFTSTAIRQTDTSEAANQDTGIQGVDDGGARLGNMESLEAREELEKQLNELSKSKTGRGRRRSRRQTSTNTNIINNASSVRGTTEGDLGPRRSSARIRSRVLPQKNTDFSSGGRVSRNKSRVTEESEQSQSDHITYDDPAGRMEREKIMAHLKKTSPSRYLDPDGDEEHDEEGHDRAAVGGGDDTTMDCSRAKDSVIITESTKHSVVLGGPVKTEPPSPGVSPTPVAPPPMVNVTNSVKPESVNLLNQPDPTSQCRSRLLTTPKFHLSAMTQEEKIDYSALVEQLGGKVYDTMYFNPACTHVVAGKPNRNEKYLAACAAGKWLLHKSYLEASREAGFFVLEDKHEWGLELPGEPLTKLASAGRRWRIKLQDRLESSGDCSAVQGAFSGWKVLLCVDKSRQPGFKRLLEAGGAKVVGIRPPFNNTDGVSHAFIDPNRTKPETLDLQALHAADIWLLKPDYIAEYLMQDPPPHPRKYLIPKVLKILQETDGGADTSYSQQRKRKAEESMGKGKRPRAH